MKHKFSKKWLALLLGAVMVVAVMIPMLLVTPEAAETETLEVFASTGTLTNNNDTISWTGTNVTWTTERNSASAFRTSDSDHFRVYKGTSTTITATNGKLIKKIVFTSTGSSYATVLGESVQTEATKTVSGSVVTLTFATPVETISIGSTAQWRVKNIEVEYEAACAHENIVAVGTPSDATCTEDGITAGEKCADCDAIIVPQEPIEATGHIDENGDSKCDTCGTNLCTEHVWVDGEVITEGDCTTNRVVAQVCEKCGEPGEDKVITAPGHTPVVDEAKDATCTETGLTEGSHCDDCDEVITKQETVPMLGHNYVNDICTVCGAEKPVLPTFEKVTSTLDDFSGTYLIVYEAGEVDVAFDGSLTTLDAASNTVGVTITDGVITGDLLGSVFIIDKTANGYTIKSASELYIGSTSFSNQLLTAKTYYNTISIDANGDAVITAESGTTLRYNNTSGQYRFRYYKSGQQPVTLYKYVEPVPEPEFNGFGVTLNKGVTVRVKFTIDRAWIDTNPTAKVTFSNGTVCDLVENESYYTTTLTPGQIGDDLTVTLGDITETVSVSTYIEKAKAANATDTTLCALLDAIEVYGKAAARVEQTLTDLGLTGVEDYNVEQNESIISGFDNVTLGQYANIGIKFEKNEDYIYVAKLGDISLGRRVLANDLDTNNVLLIENLFPANFDDVITVTVYEGDTSTVVSTMTFTFNSYLKKASEDETIDVLDRNIIIATYNYGVAAEAYLDAHQQS